LHKVVNHSPSLLLLLLLLLLLFYSGQAST
jgi:hypothetical protein